MNVGRCYGQSSPITVNAGGQDRSRGRQGGGCSKSLQGQGPATLHFSHSCNQRRLTNALEKTAYTAHEVADDLQRNSLPHFL